MSCTRKSRCPTWIYALVWQCRAQVCCLKTPHCNAVQLFRYSTLRAMAPSPTILLVCPPLSTIRFQPRKMTFPPPRCSCRRCRWESRLSSLLGIYWDSGVWQYDSVRILIPHLFLLSDLCRYSSRLARLCFQARMTPTCERR